MDLIYVNPVAYAKRHHTEINSLFLLLGFCN